MDALRSIFIESTTKRSLVLALDWESSGSRGIRSNDQGGKATVKSPRTATEPSNEPTAVSEGRYSRLLRRQICCVPRPSATPVPGAIVLMVGCTTSSVNTCSAHSSIQCNRLLAPFLALARAQEVFRSCTVPGYAKLQNTRTKET